MIDGGAKPRKNEKIIIKESLTYGGPYEDFDITVVIKNTKVKVVFTVNKDKSKKDSKKDSKTNISKTNTSKTNTSQTADTSQQIVDPFSEAIANDNVVQETSQYVLGIPVYDYNEMKKSINVEWYMNKDFDEHLLITFIKFYFGYDILQEREPFKLYTLDDKQEIETIYRKKLYENFCYFQNIFQLYCFGPFTNQTLVPIYQMDIYEIENNIYDFKDLFNNIELSDEIICVQFEENVKCPLYWSVKTLTIYPNFGQSGFSLVFKKDGVIQVQIILNNLFYVFTLLTNTITSNTKTSTSKSTSTSKKADILNIIPLQIKIKKYVKTYYEVQRQFQFEHSQFMNNFSDHFEVQKLSNTNFQIEFLNGLNVFIYTRYSTLFFSTISDDILQIQKYFKICQNCGNFEEVQPITDLNTLQIISPLEFGNTSITNFEHQLESMKKRPSVIPMLNANQIIQQEKTIQQDKSNLTDIDKWLMDIQNEMMVQGYLINGFRFFCNEQFPYLNFTKFDIECQENGKYYPVYYYKCQQVPVKYMVQNIYKLYDIYRYFKLNDKIQNKLYQKIQGLIQQKPNIFLRYETIIPGTYTILPQELYKIFPNNTFLLKLIPSSIEKITQKEYDNIMSNTLTSSSDIDDIEQQNEPWDNEWLKSVCNGQQITLLNAIFYNIETNQYSVYKHQESYDYIILIYHQQFFTLIVQDFENSQLQLGRGRQQTQIDSTQNNTPQTTYYQLYKIDFKFDKEINNFIEAHEYNQEYIQTKYLNQDVIISKQNVIYEIIPDKQRIKQKYLQKSTYDQIYMIDSNKNVIGYKQYGVYVYYNKPTKLNYDLKYVLSNLPTPSKHHSHNDVDQDIDVNLTINEIAKIIIFNNKLLLLEILPQICQQQQKRSKSSTSKPLQVSSTLVNEIRQKLQLNIGQKQDIKLYNNKLNYLFTVITEQQAKEGIQYILQTMPDSENLIQSFIINYTIEDQLYYDPSHETIKQLSQYVQLQNLIHYRNIIQE